MFPMLPSARYYDLNHLILEAARQRRSDTGMAPLTSFAGGHGTASTKTEATPICPSRQAVGYSPFDSYLSVIRYTRAKVTGI